MRPLETARGIGQLRAKDTGTAIEVGYTVSVFQEELDAAPGRPSVPGLKNVMALVHFEGDLFQWIGKEAILSLDDGRCLDGFVSDISGTFAASGNLYPCR